jgi:hypothetical protein
MASPHKRTASPAEAGGSGNVEAAKLDGARDNAAQTDTQDGLSALAEAEALAERIRQHWQGRAEVRVERVEARAHGRSEPIYCIRSNLTLAASPRRRR